MDTDSTERTKNMIPVSYDEAMENACEMILFDQGGKEYHGMWSEIRVDRDTLPEGMRAYDVREGDDADDDMLFAAIEDGIVCVNYAGTFLTEENLPLQTDSLGRMSAQFDENNGWDYSFS